MKKKDRDKLMIVYKILAVILAIAMIIGIIFGSGELLGGY
jgi:hypothetical protein